MGGWMGGGETRDTPRYPPSYQTPTRPLPDPVPGLHCYWDLTPYQNPVFDALSESATLWVVGS